MLINKAFNLKIFKKFINYFSIKKQNTILANTIQISIHKDINNKFIQFAKESSFWNINVISDLTIIDKNSKNNRFIVCYFLLSKNFCNRLLIRTFIDGILSLNSISNVFKSCTWLEREVFDLFGIFFKNNQDLRRILTDYAFKGYPLRKDFPVFGFTEKYFSISENVIITNKISFIQEFRFEQKKN